jgi:hypothetical protein
MAGDWIKMRADLFTHPKVVRMSSALKADALRTVGGLMSVWCLFDAHSTDGLLEGYTPEVLDDHLRWSGFATAMQGVGWLAVDHNNGLSLPEFDTHNGQSAKRRAQDADRKREDRKASASEADKKRTREEKRREEISPSLRSGVDTPKRAASFDPSSVELPECVSAEDWARWCADRSKRRKPVTPEAAKLQLAKLVAFMADGHLPKDVIDNSIANGYQGLFAPKAAPNVNGGHTGFAKKDYRKGVNDDGFFN